MLPLQQCFLNRNGIQIEHCMQVTSFIFTDCMYYMLQAADESAALSKPVFSKAKSFMDDLSDVQFLLCIHSFACDKMESTAPPVPKFGLT